MHISLSDKKCHGKDCPDKSDIFKMFRIKGVSKEGSVCLSAICAKCEKIEDERINTHSLLDEDSKLNQYYLGRKF